MHSGSQLTDERLAVLVGLFEQGFGYRGSARQVGVGLESARSLCIIGAGGFVAVFV